MLLCEFFYYKVNSIRLCFQSILSFYNCNYPIFFERVEQLLSSQIGQEDLGLSREDRVRFEILRGYILDWGFSDDSGRSNVGRNNQGELVALDFGAVKSDVTELLAERAQHRRVLPDDAVFLNGTAIYTRKGLGNALELFSLVGTQVMVDGETIGETAAIDGSQPHTIVFRNSLSPLPVIYIYTPDDSQFHRAQAIDSSQFQPTPNEFAFDIYRYDSYYFYVSADGLVSELEPGAIINSPYEPTIPLAMFTSDRTLVRLERASLPGIFIAGTRAYDLTGETPQVVDNRFYDRQGNLFHIVNGQIRTYFIHARNEQGSAVLVRTQEQPPVWYRYTGTSLEAVANGSFIRAVANNKTVYIQINEESTVEYTVVYESQGYILLGQAGGQAFELRDNTLVLLTDGFVNTPDGLIVLQLGATVKLTESAQIGVPGTRIGRDTARDIWIESPATIFVNGQIRGTLVKLSPSDTFVSLDGRRYDVSSDRSVPIGLLLSLYQTEGEKKAAAVTRIANRTGLTELEIQRVTNLITLAEVLAFESNIARVPDIISDPRVIEIYRQNEDPSLTGGFSESGFYRALPPYLKRAYQIDVADRFIPTERSSEGQLLMRIILEGLRRNFGSSLEQKPPAAPPPAQPPARPAAPAGTAWRKRLPALPPIPPSDRRRAPP